jgi:hypothetical protein
MRECICCQCEERAGQFKGWLRCDECGLYGPEEEFLGPGMVCRGCAEKAAPETMRLANWLRQIRKAGGK